MALRAASRATRVAPLSCGRVRHSSAVGGAPDRALGARARLALAAELAGVPDATSGRVPHLTDAVEAARAALNALQRGPVPMGTSPAALGARASRSDALRALAASMDAFEAAAQPGDEHEAELSDVFASEGRLSLGLRLAALHDLPPPTVGEEATPKAAVARISAALRHKLVGQTEASRALTASVAAAVAARQRLADATALGLPDDPAPLHEAAWRAAHRPLFLEGPHGTGRSTAARAIAHALGMRYVSHRLSAGSTATSILGEAEPSGRAPRLGILARLLLAAGSPDTVILLHSPEDAGDEAQEALAELMEGVRAGWVVDPALDMPVPLGRAIVAIACESTPGIDPPFASAAGRAVFRALPPDDKRAVFRDYLLPEAMGALGLSSADIQLTDRLVLALAAKAGTDAGSLGLRACAEALAAETLRSVSEGSALPVHFGEEDLHRFLSSDDVYEDFLADRLGSADGRSDDARDVSIDGSSIGVSGRGGGAAGAGDAGAGGRSSVATASAVPAGVAGGGALWDRWGVLASVSALDGGAGDVDLCEVVSMPLGLRGRRLSVTAMKGASQESADVALSAVVALLARSRPGDGVFPEGCWSTASDSNTHTAPTYGYGSSAWDGSGSDWHVAGSGQGSDSRHRSALSSRPDRFSWGHADDGSESEGTPSGGSAGGSAGTWGGGQSSQLLAGGQGGYASGPLRRLMAHEWHTAFVEPSMRSSDGASGGLCLALGLLSAVLERPLPRRLAVTGSMGLSGRVMQVGSIHEKTTAAALRGISVLMLPEACRRDFAALPTEISGKVRPVFVSTLEEAVRAVWGEELAQ